MSKIKKNSKIKKKNKFIKGLKFTVKWAYKICVAAAGVATTTIGVTTSQPHVAFTGLGMIASALSAAIKDKNFGKLGKVVTNVLACNIGRASNDRKLNK